MHHAIVFSYFKLFPHLIRTDHIILLSADYVQNILGRKCLIVKTHIPNDLLHQALRVRIIINCKALCITKMFNFATQNAATCAVESHSPDILACIIQHRAEPFLELIGRLIRKCNSQNAISRNRLNSAKVISSARVYIRRIFREVFQKRNVILRNGIRHLVAIAAPTIPDNICYTVNKHGRLTTTCTGE